MGTPEAFYVYSAEELTHACHAVVGWYILKENCEYLTHWYRQSPCSPGGIMGFYKWGCYWSLTNHDCQLSLKPRKQSVRLPANGSDWTSKDDNYPCSSKDENYPCSSLRVISLNSMKAKLAEEALRIMCRGHPQIDSELPNQHKFDWLARGRGFKGQEGVLTPYEKTKFIAAIDEYERQRKKNP